MTYLFLGQDSLSKDIQLKKIRAEILGKNTEQFNLDILYAKELTLKALQEKLAYLPAVNACRLLVIKGAEGLKNEIKDYLLKFMRDQHKDLVLILDMDQADAREEFTRQLLRQVKVFRFRNVLPADTFMLSRQIELKKPDQALRLLSQLLKDAQPPERILGGLRYVWEREPGSLLEKRKKLKLLLNCDLEIKTGRLKPGFALEKLVVSLCGLGKPPG
jgi:DNA polymerase III delta subunit